MKGMNEMSENNICHNANLAHANQGVNDNIQYAKININAAEMALLILSPIAFKLWFYFDENKNGCNLRISKIKIFKDCGFNNHKYNKAWNELINLGYIIKKDGSNDQYDFYEEPFC